MPIISELRKGGFFVWNVFPVMSHMLDNGRMMLMLMEHCSYQSRLIVCKTTVDGWAYLMTVMCVGSMWRGTTQCQVPF